MVVRTLYFKRQIKKLRRLIHVRLVANIFKGIKEGVKSLKDKHCCGKRRKTIFLAGVMRVLLEVMVSFQE